MRRLVGAGFVVAVLTASTVALSAPPASASVVPPPVVTLPSSVLAGVAGSATTAQTVGSLTASGGAAIGSGSTVAGGALAAGAETAGGVAAVGLMIGTWAGVTLAKGLGWPTSGSFICDVQTTWNAEAACATKPGTSWTVNGDVVATAPGFPQGNVITASSSQGGWYTNPSVQVGWVQSPAFNAATQAGSTVTANLLGGTAFQGNNSGFSVYVQTYVRNKTTGVVRSAGSFMGSLGAGDSGSGYVKTVSIPLSGVIAGTEGFDHAEFHIIGSGYTTVSWYPVGHSSYVAGVVPNPARYWRSTWQCSVGAGGSSTSAAFHETDAEWPGLPTAQCDGSALTHVLIEKLTENGPTVTISEWTAPAAYTDWVTSHGTGEELHLYRLSGGAAVDCHTATSICADWWTETAQATTGQDDYECRSGSVAVALAECTVYAHAFDLGRFSDPTTGETTDTTPTTPQEDDGCPPPFSWTSMFNPWWYYRGTVCGLKEVFVPSVSVQTAIAPLLTDLGTKVGIAWVSDSPLAPTMTLANQCPDWRIKVGSLDQNVVCESSFTHAIVAGRPVLFGLMLAAAFAPLLRSLWYAAFPVLAPVPVQG